MGIRISEMEEATTFGADDYVPIVTNGTNKKALGAKIKEFIAGFFVSKSGDTMSGDLNNTAAFANKYSGVQIDNSSDNHVSENTQLMSAGFKDNSGFVYSGLNAQVSTSGLVETWLSVKNKKTDGTSVNNYINLIARKDGTVGYDIADTAEFRKALGVNTGYVSQSGGANVASSSIYFKNIAPKITISGGLWLVSYWADFAANSTGDRLIVLSHAADNQSDVSGYSKISMKATSNEFDARLSGTVLFNTGGGSYDLYLNALQNSGSTLVVNGVVRAIRLN